MLKWEGLECVVPSFYSVIILKNSGLIELKLYKIVQNLELEMLRIFPYDTEGVDQAIADFEDKFTIKFPAKYKEFLLKYNDYLPAYNVFWSYIRLLKHYRTSQ